MHMMMDEKHFPNITENIPVYNHQILTFELTISPGYAFHATLNSQHYAADQLFKAVLVKSILTTNNRSYLCNK